MKQYVIMYTVMALIVFCADDLDDGSHTIIQRVFRTLFFPLTIFSWFRTGNIRLHRLLTILWTMLISGWLMSLIADRF